jgi:flagellar motor switch/type III secretory pathway protein FliN
MTSDQPAIDPLQQRLFDLTAGPGRHFPVRFGNDLWQIRCVAPPAAWNSEIRIPLEIGGEPAVLELTFAPSGKLFDRHAEFRDIASVSAPFSSAILAALNRELLDSLQTVLDAGITIASGPGPEPSLTLAFEITDTTSRREGTGLLRIFPSTLTVIERVATAWEQVPNPAILKTRFPVAFGVAFFEMPLAEFSRLQPGDCLILGEASGWPFPAWMTSGCAPVPTGQSVQSLVPPLLMSENPIPSMNSQPTPPANLSSLRLPVLVVAARKEMTLEEISAFRAGAAIEIGTATEIPVEIQVHNQVLATGHLVRVADKICARLTSVQPA